MEELAEGSGLRRRLGSQELYGQYFRTFGRSVAHHRGMHDSVYVYLVVLTFGTSVVRSLGS